MWQKHPKQNYRQCRKPQGQMSRVMLICSIICLRFSADLTSLSTHKEYNLKNTQYNIKIVSLCTSGTCVAMTNCIFSYYISSILSFPAQVHQPLQLIWRTVGFHLAASASHVQHQYGPGAPTTNEDVINPASDHRTEKLWTRCRLTEVKPKQFSFTVCTFLLTRS